MKTLILSHNINSRTPLYRGKGRVRLSPEKAIKNKDSSNVLKVTMNTHTSTHIDMPYHFIADGPTLTDNKPDSWIFNDVSIANLKIKPRDLIGEKSLSGIPRNNKTELLIIKTDFERFRGKPAYIRESPVVAANTAGFLKRRFPNLRAVGFDFISLSSMADRKEGRAAHKGFLKNGVLIIEDMKLTGLTNRPDVVLVSPLFIEKADAGPVSVWAFYHDFTFEKYDYIFFDFDGVVVDSEPVKVQGFVKLYAGYGRDVAKRIIEHHKLDGGLDRYRKIKLYHKEFLGIEPDEDTIRDFAKEYSRLVLDGVLKAKFINGVGRFLELCEQKRKTCFLVSSTPEAEIKKIAKRRGIERYFKSIKGSPRDKKDNIENLIRRYKVDRRRAVLFGDSANDLRAANYNDIKLIGINYSGIMPNYKNFRDIIEKSSLRGAKRRSNL